LLFFPTSDSEWLAEKERNPPDAEYRVYRMNTYRIYTKIYQQNAAHTTWREI
jgi:hypothetical protein